MTCRSLTVGAVGILYYLEHQGLFNMYIDLYIYKLYINYIYIYIYIFFFWRVTIDALRCKIQNRESASVNQIKCQPYIFLHIMLSIIVFFISQILIELIINCCFSLFDRKKDPDRLNNESYSKETELRYAMLTCVRLLSRAKSVKQLGIKRKTKICF